MFNEEQRKIMYEMPEHEFDILLDMTINDLRKSGASQKYISYVIGNMIACRTDIEKLKMDPITTGSIVFREGGEDEA